MSPSIFSASRASGLSSPCWPMGRCLAAHTATASQSVAPPRVRRRAEGSEPRSTRLVMIIGCCARPVCEGQKLQQTELGQVWPEGSAMDAMEADYYWLASERARERELWRHQLGLEFRAKPSAGHVCIALFSRYCCCCSRLLARCCLTNNGHRWRCSCNKYARLLWFVRLDQATHNHHL